MSIKKRRFVFTDFKTLQHVNFEKLEKVCDKLFVLIHHQEQHIPLPLVLSMQQMGKNAKWLVIYAQPHETLDFHLSYFLGKLDEKLSEDIEFVLLSGKENLDPLVDFINTRGRSCLRVTIEDTESEAEEEVETEAYLRDDTNEVYEEEEDGFNIDLSEVSPTGAGLESSRILQETATRRISTAEKDIENKALETVQRLQFTGNRPAEVVLLRDYIALFHQDMENDDGQADQIINKLVEDKQIEVRKGIIKYNF